MVSVAGSEGVDQNVILSAGSDIADGKFEIINLIATGATASVYRARHRLLGMEVALKILNFSLLGRADCLARFQKEARVSSQLVHSNLAKLIAYGTLEDGRPFIAIELIEGRTLSELIAAEEPMESARAIGLFLQICDGLEALHQNGIIHRDMKPGNVMVSLDENGAERAKIIDLGLIKELQSSDPKITKTGQILGSAAYMSPEQCRAERADERSDIYSFACLMYECLTGRPPFGEDTGFVTMTRQTNDPPPPIRQFRKDRLIPGLEQIINISLEKEPGKRFQSIADLRGHLRRCLDGELSSNFIRPDNSSSDVGSTPGGMFLASLLVVISLLALIGFYVSYNKSKAAAGAEERRLSIEANAKNESKQLQAASKKARRMAQSAVLDTYQVEETLQQPDLVIKCYEMWLEDHPHAELSERAGIEYRLFVLCDSAANSKLSMEHGKKAERYYLQLLNASTDQIAKSDLKSLEWEMASDDAVRYSKFLADILGLMGRKAEAENYQMRRWKIARAAQAAGAETTLYQDIEIAKALHSLGAYSSEQDVLKTIKLGADSKPLAELVLASVPNMSSFCACEGAPNTKVAYLCCLHRNQLALKKDADARRVWDFSVKYAAKPKKAFERAQVYIALAADAQADKHFSESRKFADKVLENLALLEDQNKKEVVDCKLTALEYAGLSSQMLNEPNKASHYYSLCLPYSGDRHYDWTVMRLLREYFASALQLRDQRLCDSLIAEYEKIAAMRDDSLQAKVVLCYFRVKRLSIDQGDHQKALTRIVDELIAIQGLSRESLLAEYIATAGALREIGQFQLSEKLLQHILTSTNVNDLLKSDYIQPARIALAGVKLELKQPKQSLEILSQIPRLFTDDRIPASFQMQRAITGLQSSMAIGDNDLAKHYIEQGKKLLAQDCSTELTVAFLSAVSSYYASIGENKRAIEEARKALNLIRDYCPAGSCKIALQEGVLASQLLAVNPSEARELFEDAIRIARTAADSPPSGVIEVELSNRYEAAKKLWASKN